LITHDSSTFRGKDLFQYSRAASEIRGWVAAAIANMQDAAAPVVACLACTHYGYRKDVFTAAFAEAGIEAIVLNPNERAVDDLFGEQPEGPHHDAAVRFVTRYAIPDATVEALTWFLDPISPRAVAAIQNFEHLPDLF
jgi:hypothetical protein